jgi:hypothetical protein
MSQEFPLRNHTLQEEVPKPKHCQGNLASINGERGARLTIDIEAGSGLSHCLHGFI